MYDPLEVDEEYMHAIEMHDDAHKVVREQEYATKQTNYTLHDLPDIEWYDIIWENDNKLKKNQYLNKLHA